MSSCIVEVAAGLVFRRGRVLITRRPAGKHLAGLWEFPGGKVETGETWEAALRRELLEELGITVEVGQCLAETRHDYVDRGIHLRFYDCKLRDGEPEPIGCADLAWVSSEELAQYEFPPADRELLMRLPQLAEFSRETF